MSLQYNDTANKLGIIQAEEDYCELGDAGISGNTLLIKQFTRHNNITLSKVWSWIFHATGSTYDDSNQTDLPASTGTLPTSTNKIALPSDALAVVGIEIANSSGVYQRLKPTTQEIEQQQDALGNFGRLTAIPNKYIWKGDSIILDAIPPTANSYKVYYSRGSVAFASTDTTKTAGFASEFHNVIPTGGAIEYLMVHKPKSSVLVLLQNSFRQYEIDIKKFYSKRFKDFAPNKFTTPITEFR